MDEEGIGLVLARASELRSNITNCIQKAGERETTKTSSVGKDDDDDDVAEEEEEEEEEEGLLSIRDAMESLEAQLSSLQGLQQQQMYEREAALAEIDHSRKKLLEHLKDYKGQDLQVIHEASAFASETVEENNDLLLPPYPTRPSHSLSSYKNARKPPLNGVINSEEITENYQEYPSKGLGSFVFAAAKSVLTIIGVVSILGLAGFEPKVRRSGKEFDVLSLFRRKDLEGNREKVVCPPGKVLVIEGGEARCLVKERVEIPFVSVVATPDIKYGCG